MKIDFDKTISKEADYFVIQSTSTGVIGTGITLNEAEKSFEEDLTHLCQLYNSLEDNQLTKHNLITKNILKRMGYWNSWY